MILQLLPETPENTQLHVEGRKVAPAFAQSFQSGLHPVAQLQRTLGNRNVAKLIQAKRLSASGEILPLQRKLMFGVADDQSEQKTKSVAPPFLDSTLQRKCAACAAENKEENASSPASIIQRRFGQQIQRWWDNEESEDESESWIDSAIDTVSDTASSAYDTVSETASEAYNTVSETASDTWNNKSGSEGGDDDWLPDWLPDIDIPSLSDDEGQEEQLDMSDIEFEVAVDDAGQGICLSQESTGQGSGSSGGVSVAGLTKIDWSATTGAGSFLRPKITKRKVENKTVYDVSGKVRIDYSGANPKVSFKVDPPMSKLSQCKQEKVNAFKGPTGELGKHEAEHVSKLKTFNGSEEFDHTFTGLEATNTDDLTEKVNAALNAVVQPKIKARQAAAQSASDNLDPWSKPIPGIDSCTS